MTMTTNYHRLPGISSSILKHATSDLAWVDYRTHGPLSTPGERAIDIGTAMHAALLEGRDVITIGRPFTATGDKRADLLAAAADPARIAWVKNRQSRADIAAARRAGLVPVAETERDELESLRAQLTAREDDRVVLDEEDAEIVLGMCAAAMRSPSLSPYLAPGMLAAAAVEQVWTASMDIEIDGAPARIYVRAKPDADYVVLNGGRWLLDLKSMRPGELTDRALRGRIEELSYDLSAAWYRRVLACHGARVEHFDLAFLEAGRPYDVRVVGLSPAYMERGDAKADRALAHVIRGERWLARQRAQGLDVPGPLPGVDCGPHEAAPVALAGVSVEREMLEPPLWAAGGGR